MDAGFASSGSSGIIPVRRKSDGTLSGSILTEEEFEELIAENDANLMQAAERFLSGCADIDPKKGKNTDACRYCGYRSICHIQ